ncbi:10697_t:CDS:2 [Scutellospora calospora]|uniref:10697_t:CDS:1 n=1 Tax=Scutellospora calospora TaxID=85575 RepID=A0ACA9LVK7_9GLOM|nr:10697_t:CDS:2 [Scutellospora calospora]
MTMGGVYFCANAIEGEGKLVPIAFAIASVENSDSWIWFCFNEVIEEISDMHTEAAVYLNEIPPEI